jgi:hypothetical protein
MPTMNPHPVEAGPKPVVNAAERGALLVTLLVVMVPLLLLVVGATSVMMGRNSKLLQELQETKALLAAEAAVEEAAQRAQAGALVLETIVPRDFAAGVTNSYVATSLATDDDDNDGDGLIDEADERAFEIIATGRHARAVRRVSAIVIEPAPLPSFSAAILALGTPDITTRGTARVSGFDTNINGTRAPAAGDVAGIATEPPNDTAGLLSRYTRIGSSAVVGSPPFDTTATTYNLPGVMATVQNSVGNYVPPGTITTNLGSAAAGSWQVSYCPGNLQVSGNMTGAGILLVQGNLTVTGTMRWDGLVVVLGDYSSGGSSLINGALIQGPGGRVINVFGTSVVRYSSAALRNLPTLLRSGVAINGVREIERP